MDRKGITGWVADQLAGQAFGYVLGTLLGGGVLSALVAFLAPGAWPILGFGGMALSITGCVLALRFGLAKRPTMLAAAAFHDQSKGIDALRDGVLKVKGAWEWFEAVGRSVNEETLAVVGNATQAFRDAIERAALPPPSKKLLQQGLDVMATAHRKRLLALRVPSESISATQESYEALDKLQARDTGYFDRLVAHLDALRGVTPIPYAVRNELSRLLAAALNAGSELMGDRSNTVKLDRIDEIRAALGHGFETNRTLITDRSLTECLYRCVAFYDRFGREARYSVPLGTSVQAAASAALANEIELGGAWSAFVNERLAAIERMKEVCPDPLGQPLREPQSVAPIGSITIHSATFGTEAQFHDVTRKVQEMVNAGTRSIRATHAIFGDPAYGEDKKLTIRWSSAGRARAESVAENGSIVVD